MMTRSVLLLLPLLCCACASRATTAPANTTASAGMLPLGDGHISTSPRVGYIYSCQTSFNGGGAAGSAPWIQGSEWDPESKPEVQGDVAWPNASITITLEGDRRVVSGNGLPVGATTGVFPIRPSDPAYQYDKNPNSIRAQNVLLSLPANPTPAAAPSCVPMGMIGFTLSGVAIYNGLDADGRDAAAHEVQDHCDGHPQAAGEYHYHDLSPCIDDSAGASGQHSALVGYALDGFGIYGQYGEGGRKLTDADLDACHGHTHAIQWDGKTVVMYHYHATAEYPYTVGCFEGAVQR